MRSCVIVWGACAVVAVACGGEPSRPLPPLVSRTARVEYHSDSPLDACPSAAALVEARLGQMERAFHVTGPSHITYSHYATWDALTASGCPSEATGCEGGEAIGSTSFVDFHEIVHATLEPQGRPNALVLEGAAVMYEHLGADLYRQWPRWQDAVSASATYPPPPIVLLFGGAFSAYLVTQYGVDQFMRFYRSSKHDASPDAFAAQFEQTFGVTLDVAWASANDLESLSLCDDLAPNMTLDGTEAATDTSCLDQYGVTRHVFDLDTDTPLAFETSYPTAVAAACTLTELPSIGQWYSTGQPAWLGSLSSWRPGRYYVTPYAPVAGNSFRATAGSFQGLSCAALTPYAITSPLNELNVRLRPELETWAAVSRSPSDPLAFERAVDTTEQPSPACDWYQCSSCDETTCQKLDGGSITLSGTTYIHVRTSDPHGELGCALVLTNQ